MKFYVEWKDAFDPYDEWVKDPHYKFKTFEEAVAHCVESLDTYMTLEHRIRVKRGGHKAVTMATFLPFPEEETL
jgi:hypothetical protein